MAKFDDGAYNTLMSSSAILQAIEDEAGEKFSIDDGGIDEDCECFRLWSEPSATEEARIIATAREYADDEASQFYEEETLNWGQLTVRKNKKTTICR